MGNFKQGDLVAYCPKDSDGNICKVEIGVFKKYNKSGAAGFVFYNFGSTATSTTITDLYPIKNSNLVLGFDFRRELGSE